MFNECGNMKKVSTRDRQSIAEITHRSANWIISKGKYKEKRI